MAIMGSGFPSGTDLDFGKEKPLHRQQTPIAGVRLREERVSNER